jgi:membrane protein
VNSTDSARRGWITDAWRVVADTYQNWRRARTIRLGAGIAYYALFGIVPLLSLSLVLAQLIVSESDVEQLFYDIGENLGISDTEIQSILTEVEKTSVQTGLGIVGFVSLVGAALLVFWAVQDAFDEVWEIPVQRGAKATIWHRLTALIIVGGGAILVILILVINAVADLLQSLVPGDAPLLGGLDLVIGALGSWTVLILAVGVVFQVLTRVRIRLVPLALGALSTAGLLTVGTTLLAFYLRNYASQSLTGAAAGILLMLLWLYYVAQMALVGAHFTRVLHERGPEPVDAEAITPDP